MDAAFLARGVLRGRGALWEPLPTAARSRLCDGFRALRNRKPHFNNWLLFSAMTEAFLYAVEEEGDPMRIDYALRQREQWYLGDGTYADGPEYHADYYNAYVIHPMLTDILRAVRGGDAAWDAALVRRQHPRLARAAAIQETIDRTLGQRGCWRPDGFLRIGLASHQPALGEAYITTGSLYLAACARSTVEKISPSTTRWADSGQPAAHVPGRGPPGAHRCYSIVAV